MRLNEDRIQFIAQQMVKELLDEKMIQLKGFPTRLETEIHKLIIDDLRIEDEIDAEVEKQIDSMKRDIPYGSDEWRAVYTQIKDRLCEQRNYIV